MSVASLWIYFCLKCELYPTFRFDSARGSALECAACLDVLAAKKKIDVDKVKQGKDQLCQIVSMLIGLIRANSERNI